MNSDLINQLAADEQTTAEKLSAAAESMKLSQNFQWDLDAQLMERYQAKTAVSPFMKFAAPLGWTVAVLVFVFLLSWAMQTLLPKPQPAAVPTATQEESFVGKVRNGNICAGPLAVVHGFSAFLTNKDRTGFVVLDTGELIGEIRAIDWSADGKQLAIFGNTTGSGQIYITDPSGGKVDYLLSNRELGYIMDGAWSSDRKQLVMWSLENNQMVYLLNLDGTGFIEHELDQQIFAVPQFTPGGKGIVFYGADETSTGLFQVMLDGSQTTVISRLVEDGTGFGYSRDGERLAYVEMDRTAGEAHLVSEEIATGDKAILGTLPIPKGSGSSLPRSANLSWSADGKFLVFDVGRTASDRAVYLAYADGSGLLKTVDSAYAPTISADGKCLAYISDKQVFALDLSGVSRTSNTATRLLVGNLPDGKAIADTRLDKLQWRP